MACGEAWAGLVAASGESSVARDDRARWNKAVAGNKRRQIEGVPEDRRRKLAEIAEDYGRRVDAHGEAWSERQRRHVAAMAGFAKRSPSMMPDWLQEDGPMTGLRRAMIRDGSLPDEAGNVRLHEGLARAFRDEVPGRKRLAAERERERWRGIWQRDLAELPDKLKATLAKSGDRAMRPCLLILSDWRPGSPLV